MDMKFLSRFHFVLSFYKSVIYNNKKDVNCGRETIFHKSNYVFTRKKQKITLGVLDIFKQEIVLISLQVCLGSTMKPFTR